MKTISYWLDGEYSARKSLDGDVSADVIVIGGGITGVSAAYHCVRNGFKTILIEKNEIASGSAGKNGGMVVEGLAIDFSTAVKKWGKEKAREAWQLTKDAREHVASLVVEHGIDCDFSRLGSWYLGLDAHDRDWLENECKVRQESGFASSIAEQGTEFTASKFTAALSVPDDCMLHPVKFTRGLATAAEHLGLVIYERTAALNYSENSIITAKGTLMANKIIVAIESESKIPEHIAEASREIALVTEPLSDSDFHRLGWTNGGMFWTSGDDDYLAVRRIGNRLFINGASEWDPSLEQLEKNRLGTLRRFVGYFPGFELEKLVVSHQWTGLLLYPSSYLPHIEVKGGIHTIYGQGGNGLTNGIMTGKAVADSLIGKELPEPYRESK